MTPTELRTHRKALGLSQKALALRLGVSEQAVYFWENGKRPIPKLMDLAMQALKAEAADIIDKLVEAVDDLLWFTVAGYPEPPHDISDTVMRAREALKAVKGEQQ